MNNEIAGIFNDDWGHTFSTDPMTFYDEPMGQFPKCLLTTNGIIFFEPTKTYHNDAAELNPLGGEIIAKGEYYTNYNSVDFMGDIEEPPIDLIRKFIPDIKSIEWNLDGVWSEDSEKQASILSPVRESLDEKIWDGDHLKPEVSEFCLSVIEDYLKNFMAEEEIPVHLRRVILIGSITGYQYDEDADLDANVFVDLDTLSDNLGLEKELLIYEMRSKLKEVNGELYPGTSHPVNLFLSTEEGYPPADGIYDMFTDEWIKKPGHPGEIDPYSNLKDAIDRAEQLAEKIDSKWGAAQRTKQEIDRYPQSAPQIKRQYIRYLKSLKRILDNVVNERRETFDLARKQEIDPPQASVPNVVYKYLEYNGLLDHLHEADKTLKVYEQHGSFEEPVLDIPSNAPESFTEALPAQNEGVPLVIQLGGLKTDSRGSMDKNSEYQTEPFLILVSPEGQVYWGTRNEHGTHEKLIANAVLEETGETIVNWQMDAYEGNEEAATYLAKFESYARGEFSYSTGPQGELKPTGFFLGFTREQANAAVPIFSNVPPDTQFDWEIEDIIDFESGPVSQFLGEVSGQPIR